MAKNETSFSKVNQHGMPAYMDPQCFIKKGYTRDYRSDIFSLGVLFWEISACKLPWAGEEADVIQDLLRRGYREDPIETTPMNFYCLYTRCWDQDPRARPDIIAVSEELEKMEFSPIFVYTSIGSKDTLANFMLPELEQGDKKVKTFEWKDFF